jgi:hypothetical protein
MSRSNLPEQTRQEGDAVAVLGVHVGLDLEDEAGEFFGFDRNGWAFGGFAGLRVTNSGGRSGAGRHGVLQETVEQELDAEVVHGAAEVDGRLPAGLHGARSKGWPAPSSIASSRVTWS